MHSIKEPLGMASVISKLKYPVDITPTIGYRKRMILHPSNSWTHVAAFGRGGFLLVDVGVVTTAAAGADRGTA
jgi:hypothetical protein